VCESPGEGVEEVRSFRGETGLEKTDTGERGGGRVDRKKKSRIVALVLDTSKGRASTRGQNLHVLEYKKGTQLGGLAREYENSGQKSGEKDFVRRGEKTKAVRAGSIRGRRYKHCMEIYDPVQ